MIKKFKTRLTLLPTLLAISLCAAHSFAQAQTPGAYPTKPVRVLVPLAPGGATDILARIFGQKLSEQLKAQFVVDNRDGAGGTIAFGIVAKAAPDGYTLLATSSAFSVAPAIYKNITYDPLKDFEPISLVSEAPYLLLVHPSVPANTAKDLIELARAKPGTLNFGSGGYGSSVHFALELFKLNTKINIVNVPYKGSGPALTATVAGEVNATFANSVSALPHVRAGRLRALGVTSAKRSEILPDLPTVSESGAPGFVTTTWHGWLAPKNTPEKIVNMLSVSLAKIGKAPDVKARLASDGGTPVGSTPAEFHTLIGNEITTFQKIVKSGNIKID